MSKKALPKGKNIYETDCPILYAMNIIGQKWKLPILWYIADAENQTLHAEYAQKKTDKKIVNHKRNKWVYNGRLNKIFLTL